LTERSQKFTTPGVTSVLPLFTVAVRVTAVPAFATVTGLPPMDIVSVVDVLEEPHATVALSRVTTSAAADIHLPGAIEEGLGRREATAGIGMAGTCSGSGIRLTDE